MNFQDDNFRYRLEFEEKTESFRLVLVNTINAIEGIKTVEQKGWKTIYKIGERDFLKTFVQYVKWRYKNREFKLRATTVHREMNAYEFIVDRIKKKEGQEGFMNSQNQAY